MTMQTATITFKDASTSQEAVAIVRHEDDQVTLCLSLLDDGDVELVMDKAVTKRLIEALSNTI